MNVGPCPICAEPGGFHDPAVHAENRRLIARRARLDELTRVTKEMGLYEDDEPVGDVTAAFDRGDKGVTAMQDRR